MTKQYKTVSTSDLSQGFKFETVKDSTKTAKHPILHISIAALFLSLGFSLSLTSILKLDGTLAAIVYTGAAIAAVLGLFASKSRKTAIGIGGAILLILAVTAAAKSAIFYDGFRLIANEIFRISGEQQAYHYEYYSVKHDSPVIMSAAVTALAAAAALISSYFTARKTVLVAVLPNILLAAAQVYFGLFPTPFAWVLQLCGAVFLAALINHRGVALSASAAVGAVLVIAIFIISVLLYTEKNTALLDLSEKIRDVTAINILYENPNEEKDQPFLSDTPDKIEATKSGEINQNVENGGWQLEETPGFSGSQAGYMQKRFNALPIFTLIIFAILLIPVMKYILAFARAILSKGDIYHPNTDIAARALFSRLNRWQAAFGLKTGNKLYSDYTKPLAALISEEYSQKYADAVIVWQKIVYGGSKSSSDDMSDLLGELREFLHETKREVLKRSSFVEKVTYKMKYFLF